MSDRDASDIRSFEAIINQAAGYSPYAYQQRIAEQGLPELLEVPTGTGKTMAAMLGWLYRRRFHPDHDVREGTPRWLVYVLPMRVLVEQTRDVGRRWLERLGLEDEVGVHVVMGGEGPQESLWRDHPEHDAIFIGTQDMLVSRALNRGYGSSRFAWPIDFGLFNNACQWVFDEVQLMGPALPTSRQLEGLRRKLGTAALCRSMWMSATVDESAMCTIDMPDVSEIVELGEEDKNTGLSLRLGAQKTILQLTPEPSHYARSLAEMLADRHRGGTLTIAMLNTVDRARDVRKALERFTDAEIVLIHSRFRPPDRAAHLDAALSQVDPRGPGRVVVSTQVLEAGVDISATTLFSEAATWSSIVQRAGRCNRDGKIQEAHLLWAAPPKPEPYLEADVTATVQELEALEGVSVTSEELGDRSVAMTDVAHAVLRSNDLVDLFDTTPDLSGNDIDVARFIRTRDDLDVAVAWRDLGDRGPEEDEPMPRTDERCPVPLGEIRKALKNKLAMWRHDHIEERWVRLDARDIRPGLALILSSAAGGYEPSLGWSPGSRRAVEAIQPEETMSSSEQDVNAGADPLTLSKRRWLGLRQHLVDVEEATRNLLLELSPDDLSDGHADAAIVAARFHDIGKAHESFQEMLEGSAVDDAELREGERIGRPWAKSGGSKRTRNGRRFFRHELASALALLAQRPGVLDGVAESDLCIYLVASHHGRVRLGLRSLPDEKPPPGEPERLVALGVWNGESLPAVEFRGGTLPSVSLDLSVMGLGEAADGQQSWARRMLKLRDRGDLGPFRLAFLEAVIRLADWRASAEADRRTNDHA